MKFLPLQTALVIFLLLMSSITVTARDMHPARGEAPDTIKKQGIEFVENKGQWVPEAKFKAGLPGGSLFITDGGFLYNYYSTEDLARIHEKSNEKDVNNKTVRHHAYKVNFYGANKACTYTTEEKKKNYYNYFLGNDQARWASNVAAYGKIIRKNVYEGIDAAVYSKQSSLKYDFIVRPGADVNRIVLTFDGVQPEITAEGNLKIRTSVNEVIEQAPYSYQLIDGKEVSVPSSYTWSNGKLTFDFPEGYDTSRILVIDPTLVFATYSGGTGAANYSISTTYDTLGNLYAGAYAYGSGWPVTTGAFQTAYVANIDAAINKYNATGSTLVYSTFYGGDGNEFRMP